MLKPLEIPVIFGLSIEVYFLLFFIAVPAYFFWRWFFRNRIPSPKKRLRAIWISTLVVTPFIYVGLIAILILIITREPSKSFKQTDWATNKESRFAMGDDIVSSKILINKDTSQIRHILGEPTWKDSLNKNWVYDMGTGGGFGFVLHNLNIDLTNSKALEVTHQRIKD